MARIVHFGPVIGSSDNPAAKIIVTVEDEAGHRFNVRLYNDMLAKFSPEQVRLAIKGVLANRTSPSDRYKEIRGEL